MIKVDASVDLKLMTFRKTPPKENMVLKTPLLTSLLRR